MIPLPFPPLSPACPTSAHRCAWSDDGQLLAVGRSDGLFCVCFVASSSESDAVWASATPCCSSPLVGVALRSPQRGGSNSPRPAPANLAVGSHHEILSLHADGTLMSCFVPRSPEGRRVPSAGQLPAPRQVCSLAPYVAAARAFSYSEGRGDEREARLVVAGAGHAGTAGNLSVTVWRVVASAEDGAAEIQPLHCLAQAHEPSLPSRVLERVQGVATSAGVAVGALSPPPAHPEVAARARALCEVETSPDGRHAVVRG